MKRLGLTTTLLDRGVRRRSSTSPAPGRARPGRVLLYDTKTRTLATGIVTDGDLAPEGLAAYKYRGRDYLAIANEVPGSSGTSNTTLYRLERVKPNGPKCTCHHGYDDDCAARSAIVVE